MPSELPHWLRSYGLMATYDTDIVDCKLWERERERDIFLFPWWYLEGKKGNSVDEKVLASLLTFRAYLMKSSTHKNTNILIIDAHKKDKAHGKIIS